MDYNKIKILHICDSHIRHNGRLFYSTGRKLQNGFILNGINCLNLSDRDIPKFNRSLIDINGRKFLFDSIRETIKNFKPHAIIIGHVDKLSYIDFIELKNEFQNVIFSQWFLDPLIEEDGPDFIKNKNRFLNRYQICDFNFITTSPDKLNFVDYEKTFYIPNPIDPSIDSYKSFEIKNSNYDLFIAISHGQHRGILKKNYTDNREEIISSIDDSISINGFGYNKNNPIWGTDFFDELIKCKMGLNLSRGKPLKYYSSDRISSLLGNGLLTFINSGYQFNDFFDDDEIIFYSDINELNEKLIFFKKNDLLRIKISQKGYQKAHKIFNHKHITNYIISKIFNLKNTLELVWMN
jgi:hypothetical protein